jgi:hypothetical protein
MDNYNQNLNCMPQQVSYPSPPYPQSRQNPNHIKAYKRATTGFTFGVLALALNMFAPIFGMLAIIYGSMAMKLDSTKGRAGIVYGSISLAMFVLLVKVYILIVLVLLLCLSFAVEDISNLIESNGDIVDRKFIYHWFFI